MKNVFSLIFRRSIIIAVIVIVLVIFIAVTTVNYFNTQASYEKDIGLIQTYYHVLNNMLYPRFTSGWFSEVSNGVFGIKLNYNAGWYPVNQASTEARLTYSGGKVNVTNEEYMQNIWPNRALGGYFYESGNGLETLQNQPENAEYIAYFTIDTGGELTAMNMSELHNYLNMPEWIAVRTMAGHGQDGVVLGVSTEEFYNFYDPFLPAVSQSISHNPNIAFTDKVDIPNYEALFVDSLYYLRQYQDKYMPVDPEFLNLDGSINYINEHGIEPIGVAYHASAEYILKLSETYKDQMKCTYVERIEQPAA